MRPLWKPPPHRHSVSKNVPIFEHLHLKYCKFFHGRHPKIGTFSGVGWRGGAVDFQGDMPFRNVPLNRLLLVLFLATKKSTLLYSYLQKGIRFRHNERPGLVTGAHLFTFSRQLPLFPRSCPHFPPPDPAAAFPLPHREDPTTSLPAALQWYLHQNASGPP